MTVESHPLNLKALEVIVGHAFGDIALLRAAVTHPSTEISPNYQRLEFLGDRVLGLVIADLLLVRFPNDQEGRLSRRLIALVRKETLAEVASRLSLSDFIQVCETGKGKRERDNPSIMADVTEAIIGALYIDGGLEPARKFIEKNWTPLVEETGTERDPKSALQEYMQARGLPLPNYAIIDRTGPDHNPQFTISVSVGELGAKTAKGASKREAELNAASLMLSELLKDN